MEARHRDIRNYGRRKAWRTLGGHTGGDLYHWPHDGGGDTVDESLKHLRTEDAKKYDGNRWTILDLSKAHEVMLYEGERYGLIAYSPSNITQMTPAIAQTLAELGFPYTLRQCGIRDAFEPQISHTRAAKGDSTKFANIATKTQVTRIKRLVFKALPLTVVIDRIRLLRGKSGMNKFAVLNQGLATTSKKGRCVAKRSRAEAGGHIKRRRVD